MLEIKALLEVKVCKHSYYVFTFKILWSARCAMCILAFLLWTTQKAKQFD